MHASISFLRKGSGLQDKNEKSALSGSRKCGLIWRRRWDSNPRDVLPSTRFRVELVMTTSILLHVRACSCRRLFIIPETSQKDKSFFGLLRNFESCNIKGNKRTYSCYLIFLLAKDRKIAGIMKNAYRTGGA